MPFSSSTLSFLLTAIQEFSNFSETIDRAFKPKEKNTFRLSIFLVQRNWAFERKFKYHSPGKKSHLRKSWTQQPQVPNEIEFKRTRSWEEARDQSPISDRFCLFYAFHFSVIWNSSVLIKYELETKISQWKDSFFCFEMCWGSQFRISLFNLGISLWRKRKFCAQKDCLPNKQKLVVLIFEAKIKGSIH